MSRRTEKRRGQLKRAHMRKTCERKTAFLNFAEARDFAYRVWLEYRVVQEPYECPVFPHWHLTTAKDEDK